MRSECFIFYIYFLQLRSAVQELQKLQEQATLPRVIDILGLDIRKLQTEIILKEESLKDQGQSTEAPRPIAIATETRPTPIYTKELTTYGKINCSYHVAVFSMVPVDP